MEGKTLKQHIMDAEENTIFFRSDFPQYHTESVGRVLSDLTDEGVLIRLSPGIYVRPKMTRFGPLIPSVENVVKGIAERDKAQILPSGATALNALGLSTQVPMSHCYLTTGSARKITIDNVKVTFKRSVPKNFSFKTRLVALLVQALRAMGEENVGETESAQIRYLIKQEPDKDALHSDVQMMPEWMKRIVKPMLTEQ